MFGYFVFFPFSFLSHSLVWSSLLCSGPEWLLSVVLEHLSVAEKNTAPNIFRERRTPDVQCCTDVFSVICHVLSYFQGWVVCVVLSIKSGFSQSKCRIWSTSSDNKHSYCIMCCITWVRSLASLCDFEEKNWSTNWSVWIWVVKKLFNS